MILAQLGSPENPDDLEPIKQHGRAKNYNRVAWKSSKKNNK
ncbi:MAG: hypothetical protein REH79_00235 [Spiroplasma sp.]|nr:hypothetical protein [Spiroplasma sp.]